MSEGRHRRKETIEELESKEHVFSTEKEKVQLKLGTIASNETFYFLDEATSPYEAIEERLSSQLIAQPEAIKAIITALEKSYVRSPDDNRPKASIALLGPTGTGKTETARALSEVLSAAEYEAPNLIKIDCSAYSHGHEVANLVGSPPGYVGGGVEPLLSPDSIERPGTVILFDEIEKGHPSLHKLMLQIMDDGKITLSKGETTYFRDTVVLMTSNAGAQEVVKETSGENLGFSFSSDAPIDMRRVNESAKNSFKKHFSPEFINRLDDMVTFHPLSEEALDQVLDVKLTKLNAFYRDAFFVKLDLSPAARKQLVSQAATEPQHGARPLIRLLEQQVQSRFGRYLGAEIIEEGTHVRVHHRDEFELPGKHVAATAEEYIFTARKDDSLLPFPTFEDVAPSQELIVYNAPDSHLDILTSLSTEEDSPIDSTPRYS